MPARWRRPQPDPTNCLSIACLQVEEIDAAVAEGRAGSKGRDKDPRFRKAPKPDQVREGGREGE